MKTITNFLKISTVLMLTVFLLSSLDSYASHFRGGQLTWKPLPAVSPTTAEFTFTTAWRWSAFGNPALGTNFNAGAALQYGDGNNSGGLSFKVIAIDPANDWCIGIAVDPGNPLKTTIDHTYATADNAGTPWLASYTGCCRTGIEINNPNGSWTVITYVELVSGNRSPVSSLPNIVNMIQGPASSFVVPAADPDPNTSLTFRLATPAEAGPGFSQPVAGGFPLSINPTTGVVTWNTTAAIVGGLYSIQVIIEDRDAASGALRTSIPVDFLIQIVNCAPGNLAPVFVAPSPACGSTIIVQAGDNVSFTVAAADIDAGDVVTLNTAGVPTGASMTPTLPVAGLNGTSSIFSWNTTLAEAGNDYVVSFTATDNCGLQTLCSYTISVKHSQVPVSNWAIILGVLLIGAFMVVRYKRNLA